MHVDHWVLGGGGGLHPFIAFLLHNYVHIVSHVPISVELKPHGLCTTLQNLHDNMYLYKCLFFFLEEGEEEGEKGVYQ